jgi:hypothetical protein
MILGRPLTTGNPIAAETGLLTSGAGRLIINIPDNDGAAIMTKAFQAPVFTIKPVDWTTPLGITVPERYSFIRRPLSSHQRHRLAEDQGLERKR